MKRKKSLANQQFENVGDRGLVASTTRLFLPSITTALHLFRGDHFKTKREILKGIKSPNSDSRAPCHQATACDESCRKRHPARQLQKIDCENQQHHFSRIRVESSRIDKVADSKSTASKMLLDLPPEILEMILLVLPPDSFAVMLMTSKAIRVAILGTPKILRVQLVKLPGLRLSDQSTVDELLKAFHERAALAACNGVQAFADIVVNKPSMNDSIELWTRPRLNWIQRCCVKGCDRGVLATAADYRGAIHVYRIRKGRIIPLCKLDPRNLGLDEDGSPRIRYRCIAMRWQRCNNSHLDHLVALFSYSIERFPYEGPSAYRSKFVSEAAEKAERTYHLCGWKLCKDTNTPAFGCEILAPLYFEPIMITTTEDYCTDYTCYPIAVIFKNPSSNLQLYKISIYQVTNAKTIHIPVKTNEVDGVELPGHSFTEAITRARFTPGATPELWLYGADTAPMDNVVGCVSTGITSLRMSSTVGANRPDDVLFTRKTSPTSFKGMAIKSEHAHECGVYENGSKYCVQTVLELVMPRRRHAGAFIVKYAEEQESCSPFDLNLELPPLEFTVVAKLLGLDGPTASPMKHIIAFSPDKEWIAIADWDKVKIWGIQTEAFLKRESGSIAPLTSGAPGCVTSTWTSKQNRALKREFFTLDDKAYTTNCAHGYFHDHIRIKGDEGNRIVGIQPVELPSRGVVFNLAFAKKNILWAWTDRGLVKWAWNKKRQGLREEILLEQVPDNLWGHVRS